MLKLKDIIKFITQPKAILLFIALGNFFYFFSQSNTYQSIGSHGIDFCLYCAWYWDWSLTNLPSLSLFAVIFLFFNNWKSYAVACLISSYETMQGMIWLSTSQGLFNGLINRFEIISNFNSEYGNRHDLIDFQYLFALVILLVSLMKLGQICIIETQKSFIKSV